MIYRTDYHVHTLYSDGKALPDEYIGPAREAGLKELGFSEHLVLFNNNYEWSMDAMEAIPYLEHVKSLGDKTKDLKVRAGLEIDYLPGMEKEISSFLESVEIDYAIGSVHYLGDFIVDLGPEPYEGKNIDRLWESYFNNVMASAASGLFDIIAHCDLIRIFGFFPDSDPEPHYRSLAKSLKLHDVAFEINTNGRNKPIGDFYPDRRFLKIFREEGVPVCVNSDGHMPSRVGQYFDEAYSLLKDAGFTEMAVFEKRKRFMIPFE